MPSVDDGFDWESLGFVALDCLENAKSLVEDKPKVGEKPFFRVFCMHNVQIAKDPGESCYSCKNNLRTLGYFTDLEKATHRARIHSETCPRHGLTADQASKMLAETPDCIQIAFCEESEVVKYEEEQKQLKLQEKQKKKAKNQAWQEEAASRSAAASAAAASRRARDSDRGRDYNRDRDYKRDRDRTRSRYDKAPMDSRSRSPKPRDRMKDRDRSSASGSVPEPEGSPREPHPPSFPPNASASSRAKTSSKAPPAPKAPAVGGQNTLNLTDAAQMHSLSISISSPGMGTQNQSPKSVLLEWLTATKSGLENSSRLADFMSRAFAEEANNFHRAKLACSFIHGNNFMD